MSSEVSSPPRSSGVVADDRVSQDVASEACRRLLFTDPSRQDELSRPPVSLLALHQGLHTAGYPEAIVRVSTARNYHGVILLQALHDSCGTHKILPALGGEDLSPSFRRLSDFILRGWRPSNHCSKQTKVVINQAGTHKLVELLHLRHLSYAATLQLHQPTQLTSSNCHGKLHQCFLGRPPLLRLCLESQQQAVLLLEQQLLAEAHKAICPRRQQTKDPMPSRQPSRAG